MVVTIAYGKSGLEVALPDTIEATVVEPKFVKGAPGGGSAAVHQALLHPIDSPPVRDLASSGSTVGIVFSDITRATPYEQILPPLLEQLSHVPDENILLFNATGTHRTNTAEELATILGADISRRFRIIQNDCNDEPSHTTIGTTSHGNNVSLLSTFLACDLKILTGFIEPHFFAGMSGGGKAIMPGLATLKTIQYNHRAYHMDHADARWGITDGNPVWEDVREAALLAGPLFLLNVAMNRDKEITAVFAGDFLEAHKVGCEYVRTHAMAPVPAEFDIVVTSNSGYPLDLNMYQAVKGMSAAKQIARKGGHIIIAAECWDGIPDHGEYGRLLSEAESPGALLDTIRAPGFVAQDMWQAQIHAMICEYATVHFYSNNLTQRQIETGFMRPTDDIGKTVAGIVHGGGGDRVCVLPQGPLTIPYVNSSLQ